MNSLAIDIQKARAQHLTINDEALHLDLTDGRTIIAPLMWYPRLWHGTLEERQNYEIIGEGAYIHWPDVDEDLSVAGILAGRRSVERAASLKNGLNPEREEKILDSMSTFFLGIIGKRVLHVIRMEPNTLSMISPEFLWSIFSAYLNT